jgi:hypothetical protein
MLNQAGTCSILEAALAVEWAAYTMSPSTEWYEPSMVPAAFEQLMASSTEREAQAAYDAMMNAIAHNHFGWLYAAAAPAAPLLVRAVRESDGWVRHAALEALVDCLYFAADDPDSTFARTRDLIRDAVESARDDLEAMAREPGKTPTNRSAGELLNALADGPRSLNRDEQAPP